MTVYSGGEIDNRIKRAVDVERERIIEWSKEDCPHMERTPASKSHCYKCWQALKGESKQEGEGKPC